MQTTTNNKCRTHRGVVRVREGALVAGAIGEALNLHVRSGAPIRHRWGMAPGALDSPAERRNAGVRRAAQASTCAQARLEASP